MELKYFRAVDRGVILETSSFIFYFVWAFHCCFPFFLCVFCIIRPRTTRSIIYIRISASIAPLISCLFFCLRIE